MKKCYKYFVALFVIIAAIFIPVDLVSAATSPPPITRNQVEQRALSMINLKWTYNASKNSNIASANASSVKLPSQFNKITSAEKVGIPYCWGGLDGIDTSSYNASWTNFKDAISKGAYAGNVNTRAGRGYIKKTAGLDCSGFVQAAYNIHTSKLSTSTMFDKYFSKIKLSDIKHMDILDNPISHVVLFDKWGTLNGVYGAFTYEATPDQTYGGIMGTKEYFMPMKQINKGYIAGRYKNIVEDSTSTSSKVFSNGTMVQVVNVNTAANFRSSANTNSALVGIIPKGTILTVLEYSNDWYKANYNNKAGWIYGNLIASAPSAKYVTVNGAYRLNIRSSASTSSKIVGSFTQGQYALVLGTNKDGSWTNVSINGVKGWAASKYLK